MLDFNISLELNPNLPAVTEKVDDRLIITSCAVHVFAGDRIFSNFDEMCYNDLNSNNFSLGVIDFEIGFSGYSGKPYPKVFVKCFALRTDNELNIKPLKINNNTSESKINQRGETVIGIRYYFQDKEQIRKIENCNRLMFESFFALGNPRKTYAFMCQLCKTEDGWKAEYANTYRNTGKASIKGMVD